MYRKHANKGVPCINGLHILGFNRTNEFCVSDAKQNVLLKFNINGELIGKEVPTNNIVTIIHIDNNKQYVDNGYYLHPLKPEVYDAKGALIQSISDKVCYVEQNSEYKVKRVFGNLLLCVKDIVFNTHTNVNLFTYYNLDQDKFISEQYKYRMSCDIYYDSIKNEILHKNNFVESGDNITVYDMNMCKLRSLLVPQHYRISCVSNGKMVMGKRCKNTYELYIFSSHDGKLIFSDTASIPIANNFKVYVNCNNGDVVIVDTNDGWIHKGESKLYTYKNTYAFSVFSLILGLCDSYLVVNNNCNSRITRFFNIVIRLPMDIQMIICHRLSSCMKNNITASDVEANFARMM